MTDQSGIKVEQATGFADPFLAFAILHVELERCDDATLTCIICGRPDCLWCFSHRTRGSRITSGVCRHCSTEEYRSKPAHPEAPRAELGLPEGVRGKLLEALACFEAAYLDLTEGNIAFPRQELRKGMALVTEAIASAPQGGEPVAPKPGRAVP